MSRPVEDPSGRAQVCSYRLPPRYLARLPALARKWGCTKTEAAQRAVKEAIDREVGLFGSTGQ